MAERHVGSGKEYTTLATAAAAVKPGDVVIIHDGTYREALRPPRGTTWQGAEGEARPIIDGGWAGGKTLPGEASATQVLVDEADVTLRGLEIRNVRGRGVTVTAGGDNFLMENCEVHHTAAGGFGANGMNAPISNIIIQGCHVHDISLTGRWYETPVNGCFLFKNCRHVLVEDTLVERGHGEGIAAGTRSTDITLRRITVRDTTHLLCYASNRAQKVLIEDCIFYQQGLDDFRQGDGDVGAGIVIGDETRPDAKDDKWPHAEDVTIRGCLVVNAVGLFQLRAGGRGYNTPIQRLVVEGCTFVAGPDTRQGLSIGAAAEKPPRGAFQRNLFINPTTHRNDAAGVRFEDNAWTDEVPAGLPASNVRVPATALVAPLATPGAPLLLDNYRPRPGSVVVGYGALEPLPVEPPPDPEPEPAVDWAALRALAAEATAEMVTASMAVDKATRLLQALDNRMREYEVAAEGGEE